MRLTRRMMVLAAALGMFAASQAAFGQAAQPAAAGETVVPPSRPAPLTVDQQAALAAICAEPPHVAIGDVHASMTEQQAEFLTEEQHRIVVNASAPAFYLALAGGILAVLVSAAPL